jgi:V/A-type H+-transporting ATPase subunit E
MSLEKIIGSIRASAETQADAVVREATEQANGIIQAVHQQAGDVYDRLCAQEQQKLQRHREKVLVNARLDARRAILQAKQELIDDIFDLLKVELVKARLKKKEIFSDGQREAACDLDFYLAGLRNDYESQVALRLFT